MKTFFFLSFFLCLLSHAESEDFLVQSDQAVELADSGSITIQYNSSKFSRHHFDHLTKQEILNLIKSESTRRENLENEDGITIPFGPLINWDSADTVDIQQNGNSNKEPGFFEKFKLQQQEIEKEKIKKIKVDLESIDEDSLKEFVSKKHGFLNLLKKSLLAPLDALKIKKFRSSIQKTLDKVNMLFYEKIYQISHSNTVVIPLFFNVSIGLSMGEIFLNSIIKNSPLKKYIQSDKGFFLSTSLGIAISKMRTSEGKSIWFLDIYCDFETYKTSFIPIIDGGVAIGSGFFLETRQNPHSIFYTTSPDYETNTVLPLIGNLAQGRYNTAFTKGLGFNGPFPSTFLQTNIKRNYLHIVLYKKGLIKEISLSFLEKLLSPFRKKRSSSYLCLGLYGN